MNLRKKLGKQRHLEKATEAERLEKQAPPLHIRQVQAEDTGGTARGHTETPILGGRMLKKNLVSQDISDPLGSLPVEIFKRADEVLRSLLQINSATDFTSFAFSSDRIVCSQF